MKKPRLIAADMDGTFLDARGTYDAKRMAEVLDRLEQENIIFTVASGRALLGVDKLFEPFRSRLAVVAENGCIASYQDKILYQKAMPKEQYLSIVADVARNPYSQGVELLLSGSRGAYVLASAPKHYVKTMEIYYENIQEVLHFEEVTDTILKVTTSFSHKNIAKGEAWLNQERSDVTAVTTGFESIDIIPKGVDKGFGLRHLCQELGITMADVMAFGDNLNDLQMLEECGVAIAVENARDEIKAVSDLVIGHHDKGAVLDFISSEVLG